MACFTFQSKYHQQMKNLNYLMSSIFINFERLNPPRLKSVIKVEIINKCGKVEDSN